MFCASLGAELTLFEKLICGALFGGNRSEEIPRMADLYRAGKLKLDELITTRYTIDEINPGLPGPP
jgi:alcohol dehydrogenase (nicotinoprotein)